MDRNSSRTHRFRLRRFVRYSRLSIFFREIVMLHFLSGLKYKLRLEFPAGYPYTAPTVRFVTPCFHPNVDQHGNICLDILKEKWSALYEVRTILLSIQSLLGKCIFTQCKNSMQLLSATTRIFREINSVAKREIILTEKNVS